MPLTIYDTSGNPVWDTDSVAGGIIADVKTFDGASTATLTYPTYAGRQVVIIPVMSWSSASASNVTADTTLGYPRVVVGTAGATRRFAVMVI